MSDFDRDELLLTGAFDEFTTGSTPKINAEGTAAVRKRVARRRRNRTILLVLLAVIAVGVPVAVYAVKGRDDSTKPGQHAAAASPSVSAGASVAAASPSVTPPPGPSGVTRELLQLSTITVPDWRFQEDGTGRCMSGPMKISAPPLGSLGTVRLIGGVVDANLDADPALEAAAILECAAEQSIHRQVVAFELDGSGGRILTIGQVMQGFPISMVRRTSAGGGVTVDLQNVMGCCGVSPDMVLHQQRGYAWNGLEYVQIDGPTAFPPHPQVTDLKVTAGGLSFGPLVGGEETRTVKITVTNLSKVASHRFLLTVGAEIKAKVTACAGSRCYQPKNGLALIIDGIAAGKKVTLTVTLVTGERLVPLERVSVQITPIGSKDDGRMADLDERNNRTYTQWIAG